MFTSIMVPLDGSAFGEQALPIAATLARRASARLELVHVHASMESPADNGVLIPVDAMDRWDAEVREAEALYLSDAARRVLEREQVTAHVALVAGRVTEALQAHAAGIGADLVVMSTHGRGGLARAWLGSVADGLLRRLSVPLLLVKPTEGPPRAEAAAPFRRVLVALDGSRAAEAVLAPALATASLCTAGVRFLTVVATTVAVPAGVGASGELAETDGQRVTAAAYLQGVREMTGRRGLSADADVVVHPSAAEAILEDAGSAACDLIAMATHGRGGAARFLLGSVTDKVVRASPLPVLVQRIPRLRVVAAEPGS